MSAPLRIAILDPALSQSGGAHNRGFAASLARWGRGASDTGVWCHQSLPAAQHRAYAAAGLHVVTPFSIRFYELLRQSGDAATHAGWIASLAREYAAALSDVLRHWPSGPILTIYHTLSWEHARALADALAAAGTAGARIRHMALLMYSPGLDESGAVWDEALRANFLTAFGALAACAQVTLYANCAEYAGAYAALLGRPEALPLHPCFLGDWSRLPQRQPGAQTGVERLCETSNRAVLSWLPWRRRGPGDAQHGRTHLLYLGIVKDDKGFAELPARIRPLLRKVGAPDRYVIQFFGPGAKLIRRSQKVADVLRALAKKYPRLIVHEGFWSDAQLSGWLDKADTLHLAYDRLAYRHKTSGLLWLAAWHGVEAIVPADCWLAREAARLGVAHTVVHNGQVIERHGAREPTDYFRAIFTPFWPWVQAQWVGSSEASLR
jgi:hypothetical protein